MKNQLYSIIVLVLVLVFAVVLNGPTTHDSDVQVIEFNKRLLAEPRFDSKLIVFVNTYEFQRGEVNKCVIHVWNSGSETNVSYLGKTLSVPQGTIAYQINTTQSCWGGPITSNSFKQVTWADVVSEPLFTIHYFK